MQREQRILSLKQLLQNEPEDVFLNYVLGIEYAAINKLTEAKDQFITVINLDPQYIAAYYQIGKVFEKENDKEAALNYYRTGALNAKEQNNNKPLAEFEEAIFLLED